MSHFFPVSHLEHEVLQRRVEPDVLPLAIDPLDVRDDVVAEELAQGLVLALEEVEEEGEEVDRGQEVTVPKENQGSAQKQEQIKV